MSADPLSDDDFKSEYDKDPLADYGDKSCEARGLSVRVELQAALKFVKNWRKRYKTAEWLLAKAEFANNNGRVAKTFSHPDHYTWWPGSFDDCKETFQASGGESMTQVWLKSTSLGRLDIVEIFDYMDGPKLFACLSEFQRPYLIIWFGEEGRYRRFLGVAVSESRFQMIRSGGIPLAIAFREPESGVVFRFSFTAGQEPQVEPLLAEQISPALLPDEDDVLSLPTETISQRMKDLALAQKAISTRRETLEVHLDFESWYREEAPVKGLGRLLTSTQELIDSLGQRLGGVATMRGAIPPDILFATEARVVQAGGGSFGLEISASQISGLYGESLIGRSMRRLVDLLKLGDDAAALREALIDIKPRAVSKFREFLTVVVDNKITFATTFASPDSVNNASVTLPLSRAAAALLIAEQVNKEGTRPILGLGVFDAVDIPRKSFGVVLGQQTYRGRILDQALPDARNVTIGTPYYFRLLESLEVSSSGEEKLKYELEMISTEPLVIPE